jgi:hypothetical protein
MAKQVTRVGSGLFFAASLAVGAVIALSGCEKGGVGDPCIPEDEYQKQFGGYSETEVNIESRSFQCETRVCLVNKFRGRVSCPYGNQPTAAGKTGDCKAPDGVGIDAQVAAQLRERPPSSAVYCSCRCAGKTKDAPYCECPSGFSCEKLIDDIGLGNSQLAGSYCVRSGTNDKIKAGATCTRDDLTSCGGEQDFYR